MGVTGKHTRETGKKYVGGWRKRNTNVEMEKKFRAFCGKSGSDKKNSKIVAVAGDVDTFLASEFVVTF